MLRVRTYLSVSALDGTGLFAAEFIPKDALVWTSDAGFDLVYPKAEIAARCQSDPVFAEYVRRYTYEDRMNPGFVVFNVDDGRFMNDSTNPTCFVGEDGMSSYAIRDLQPGEELTNDYEHFLADSDVSINVDWRDRRG